MLDRRDFVSSAASGALVLSATAVGVRTAVAETQSGSPISRQTLATTEYPDDQHICIQQMLEAKPNLVVPRHTHPGVEASYVISGSLILSVDGQPDRLVKACEAFLIPANTPHSGRVGPDGMRSLGTFFVEKQKPLLSPAPETPRG